MDEPRISCAFVASLSGMRVCGLMAIAWFALACDRDDTEPATPATNPAVLTESSGEVMLTDGGRLSYEITSERYKQWYLAQQGLDRATAQRFGQILRPDAPSQATIARAAAYLTSQPSARASIARSGLSVADFVSMTVALQQQLRDAPQMGGEYAQPYPGYIVPPPLDSSLPQQPPVAIAPMDPIAQPVPPTTPAPSYGTTRDTFVYVTPRNDSLRIQIHRDSAAARRRDSIIRALSAPPPRDSVQPPAASLDTSTIRPDSLPR
jgi:hypothetical protein